MKRHLSVADLARDDRFERMRIEDLVFDPRNALAFENTKKRGGFTPESQEAPDAARSLMHGIFVGEIQALEGAGRTCYDFDTGAGDNWDAVRVTPRLLQRASASPDYAEIEMSPYPAPTLDTSTPAETDAGV